MLIVNDLMTPNPKFVTPETSLSQVMRIMQKEGFRQLPVVQDEKLVGIITDRDVRIAVNFSPNQQEHEEQKQELQKLKTGDYMTTDPVNVPIDMPAYRAAEILRLYKFGALIVVNKREEAVGIISVTDFLKSFTQQWRSNKLSPFLTQWQVQFN